MKHTIGEEIWGVLVFIGAIWLVFLADWLLPFNLLAWGLRPRTLAGLAGIVTAPFLHASWTHLTSNTIPLLVLLTLLAGSKARSGAIVVGLVLLGGSLLWLFGRSYTHVGASGLVFGLIAFLIVSGVLERRLVPMLVAVIVGFFYGGSLLWGVIPSFGSSVSWDGHLLGAIAGGLLAYALTREPTRAQASSVGPKT